jgi:Flp pilus assembly protein TadD
MLKNGIREPRAYLGLSDIAFHRNQLSEAQAWAQKAAEIQPKERVVLLALGRVEAAQGNRAGARKFLEEARKQGDDSAALHSLLGEIYSELKDWPAAEAEYREALNHERRNTKWRSALASVLLQLGKRKEAEEKYREILALEPNSPSAWKALKELGKRY